MIKKLLINWVLPTVLSALLEALKRLAMKSDNDIDDHIVAEIAKNQDRLVAEIKASL